VAILLEPEIVVCPPCGYFPMEAAVDSFVWRCPSCGYEWPEIKRSQGLMPDWGEYDG